MNPSGHFFRRRINEVLTSQICAQNMTQKLNSMQQDQYNAQNLEQISSCQVWACSRPRFEVCSSVLLEVEKLSVWSGSGRAAWIWREGGTFNQERKHGHDHECSNTSTYWWNAKQAELCTLSRMYALIRTKMKATADQCRGEQKEDCRHAQREDGINSMQK